MSTLQIKDDIHRIRNLFLYNFISYSNNKIDIDELCKRLKRLDKIYKEDIMI